MFKHIPEYGYVYVCAMEEAYKTGNEKPYSLFTLPMLKEL